MKSNSICLGGSLFVGAMLLTSTSALASYTDITATSGISLTHSLREDAVNNHAGVSTIDVNADGLTDLLFAKFNAQPFLYVNQGDGTFVDEASARGLSGAVDAAAFGAGDFDNDGDVDLFMTPHEGNRFFLYINDGTGNFTEEAVARGADVTVTLQPHKGYSVSLVDYNLDGYLDISVSEWGVNVDEEVAKHSPLLRNRGAEAPGSFVLATEEAGLVQPPNGSGNQQGYTNAWADFDGDGWQDLALIADFSKSQMYWNNGDGTFTRSTQASGVGFDEFGMGVAVADYNADGLLDFYVTSIYDAFSFNQQGTHTGNKLYLNTGNRNFQESAFEAGVSRTGWGWGTAVLDYENDGDFDLIATNGHNFAEGGDINSVPLVAANSDPTTLFLNDGSGSFSTGVGAQTGIVDNRYGKGLVVFDYDNDGDQDIAIANSFSNPILYESNASTNGNDWIRFTFEGTISNRDAFGTQVRVTDGGKTQFLNYNPTSNYLGQHESALHFGLGDGDGTVDLVTITWPTGLTLAFENLTSNQVHHLVEPDDAPTPPLFSQQPSVEGAFGFGESLELNVVAIGDPDPVYVWEKDGEVLEGQTSSRLFIKRLAPFDAGVYRARAINSGGETFSQGVAVEVELDVNAYSVARLWNEFMLEAIRKDFPDPTHHGRNLYHVSAAMWDAFWPYEEEQWSRASEVFYKEELDPAAWGADRLAAQREAISHAAYTVLAHRYEDSAGATRSLFDFRWLMQELGFDPDFVSQEGDSPAAVGNRIGNAVLQLNYGDGSNELNGYADTSGYEPVNEPLVVELSGTQVNDVNRWQPLAFDFAVSQNGIPIGELVQSFLGVNWREVDTFALAKTSSNTIAFDPGPPPQFEGDTKQAFVDSTVELIRFSSYLDPSNSEIIDISPGARLNNRIGTNDGTGRPLNPVTGQPYEPNEVKLADYGRILAEYWADGPASETPPGHWNSLHNEVVDHPLFERRYMGQGEELSELEWDVRAYLALNGAMHDAAMAAWTLKRQYDYSRPITMIRHLGGNGQSSDPELPSYSEDGLPLIPGLIELVTEESSQPGQRHAHLVSDPSDIGRVAIFCWAGEPDDPHTEFGGVDWIWPEDWLPYQRGTFVSPAFAAYVSGHSTFSRAGAEVMNLLTGTPYFPGGMGEFYFPQSEFLEFEDGPSEDVTLQWATYYDAADQAGVSRLYGGIHVRADDFVGRILGARVGVEAFVKAHTLRNAVEGTGVLGRVVSQQSPAPWADAALTRLDYTSNETRPIRFARSIAEALSGDSETIYIIVEDVDDAPVRVLSRDGTTIGVETTGFISETEVISVELVLDYAEPIIALALGQGSSLEEGATDAELEVYRLEQDEWVLFDANNDWLDDDEASLSEVLGLRKDAEFALEERESALPLTLPAGSYRIELRSAGDGGLGRLSVFGQSWSE